jgi:hypothetical protein
MPVLLTARPARRGSIRADLVKPRPLDFKLVQAIMRAASKDPRVDLHAEQVLRVLLFVFLTWQTGACAPSLYAIARRAKMSRATVCRRLGLLESLGYVQRVRRSVQVNARAGWRGAVQWCQATTAYSFLLPPNCESQAEAPSISKIEKRLKREVRAATLAPVPDPGRNLLAERIATFDAQRRAERSRRFMPA